MKEEEGAFLIPPYDSGDSDVNTVRFTTRYCWIKRKRISEAREDGWEAVHIPKGSEWILVGKK